MKLTALAVATLATGLVAAAPAPAQRTIVRERTVVTHRRDVGRHHSRTVCHAERHGHHVTRVCRTVRH